jgi:hypothetical protein
MMTAAPKTSARFKTTPTTVAVIPVIYQHLI